MNFPRSMPTRMWVCPACDSRFNERWLLARHLREVHGLRRGKATDIAAASEYVLNPQYLLKSEHFLKIGPEDYEALDGG